MKTERAGSGLVLSELADEGGGELGDLEFMSLTPWKWVLSKV